MPDSIYQAGKKDGQEIPAAPIFIYVHIPFCRSKCGYCAFNSRPLKSKTELRTYFDALSIEIGLWRNRLAGTSPQTIFFGGGTPSLAEPEQLSRLLQEIGAATASADELREITLEANPDTLSFPLLQEYRQIGINRVSLGVQSFATSALTFLERNHQPAQALQSIRDARTAGFHNLGLDLIAGLPAPNSEFFRSDLEVALAHAPEHLSVYLLSLDEPSRLAQRVKSEKWRMPDAERQADIFLEIHDTLTGAGYEHYEVSNFARPGFRAQHNSAYWSGAYYLGCGAGAHSYVEQDGRRIRMANTTDPDEYVHQLSRGLAPTAFQEEITDEMNYRERLMLALRTSEGLDPNDFDSCKDKLVEELTGLIDNGWYNWDGRRFRPTAAGMLVADGVAASLWDSIA